MSAPPTTRRTVAGHRHGRVPRAVRERQVLDLAEALFAEAGYAGASMDELARRAGISKPVVYDLVGSKELLYRRCVMRQSEELAGVIAAAAGREADPARQLHAGILSFFQFVERNRRVWEALAGDTGPFAATAREVRRRQTDLVVGLVGAGAARAGVPLDATRAEATAHLLNGAIDGLARWWAGHPELSAEQCADWAAELMLPGVAALVSTALPGADRSRTIQ